MSGNPTTYGELHDRAVELLGSRFEAGQLFTHVTQKKVYHLSFLMSKSAPAHQVELLIKMCRRRRAGEPLQYLLGEWEFYGLPFKVGRGVLIPRADTEALVDVALELLDGMERPEVLDLCSGTGCVAVAVAKNRPNAAVTALELSEHAFAYLSENIAHNGCNIKAVRGDLKEYRHHRPVTLLLANPPYIPREAIPSLQPEVRREPAVALAGGKDGLDFYRAIVRQYFYQIENGGWVAVEVGAGQSDRVASIFAENGLENIGARDDYAGIPRVIYAQKPHGKEYS